MQRVRCPITRAAVVRDISKSAALIGGTWVPPNAGSESHTKRKFGQLRRFADAFSASVKRRALLTVALSRRRANMPS